jgi:hypothetical protein
MILHLEFATMIRILHSYVSRTPKAASGGHIRARISQEYPTFLI